MVESGEQIVSELKAIKELLVQVLDAVKEVDNYDVLADILDAVKDVDNTIGGWTAYPYLEEVKSLPE